MQQNLRPYLTGSSAVSRNMYEYLKAHYSKFSKKHFYSASLAAAMLFPALHSNAQTITFSGTPEQDASEYVEYSATISASSDDGTSLNFSGVNLPQWLTLSSEQFAPSLVNQSTISDPGALAQDASGNFYVIERSTQNKKVYKITPNGTTTLLTSVAAPYGNVSGAEIVGNYLYISLFSSSTGGILRYDITQQNPTATVIYPGSQSIMAMTYKSGYLYIANFSGNKVGRIRLSDNTYSDYLTGVAYPGGLAFTPNGRLLVSLHIDKKIVSYDGDAIQTVLPSLPAQPMALETDASGNVYVAFWSLSKIRKYNSTYTSFTEVSGNTTGSVATLITPQNSFYWTDLNNGGLYTLRASATISGTPSHNDVGVHNFKIKAYGGEISKEESYSITVADKTNPELEGLSPMNNKIGVALNSTLKVYFAEEVLRGQGKIYIKSSLDNSIIESFDISSQNIIFDGYEVGIKPTQPLPVETQLYVTIDEGAIMDNSGNIFAGISDSQKWTFKTAENPKISITSTPNTEGVENKTYSTTVNAIINTDDELTYSAIEKPEWLTLTPPGSSTTAERVNTTQINYILGVTKDKNGNYYVDAGGTGIYKIDPSGAVTTFVSHSANCYDLEVVGDYLYVSYNGGTYTGIVRYSLTASSPVGESIYSEASTRGLTFHDGFIYTTIYYSNKIVKINPNDKTFSDYITNIKYPFGITFSPTGDALVSTYYELGKITRFTDGVPTVVVSNLIYPADLFMDKKGVLTVGFQNEGVRRYSADFTSSMDISGGKRSNSIYVDNEGGLAFADRTLGNLYAVQPGAKLTGTPKHEDVGEHLVKIKVTNGSLVETQEFTIEVTDPNPPQVEAFRPANTSIEIAPDSTLSIEFDETIKKGAGNIYITSKSNNQVLQTIDVANTNVSVNDKTLKIKLTKKMPTQTDIYIGMDYGTVTDIYENQFFGIENPQTWAFRTIERTPQVITYDESKTVTYGDDDFAPNGKSDAELQVSYTSSNESVAKIVDGKIHIVGAGETTITANQEGNEEYAEAEPVKQVLTVDRKEITANISESSETPSKIYDGKKKITLDKSYFKLNGVKSTDDVYAVAYSNFEDANAGTNKTINVGEIMLSGESAANYKLTTLTLEAKGTILPKPLTAKAEAEGSIEKIYDGNADAPTNNIYQTLEGVVGEDDVAVSGKATFNDKNAGDKTVTVKDFVLKGEQKNNYKLANESVELPGLIIQKMIVISANEHSKVYGTNDPAFTYTVDELVEGDQMSGSLTREPGKNVGEYEITLGTLTAGDNYALEGFSPATFKITPAQLVITADNKTKKQGEENPSLTLSYTGFANGDKASDLESMPVVQTNANAKSPIGYYEIMVTGASSDNYTISYAKGRLEVVPTAGRVKAWSNNSTLTVRVYSEVAQKSAITLYTEIGQPIVVQRQQLQPGINTFSFPITPLTQGFYVLNVSADKFNEGQRVKIK